MSRTNEHCSVLTKNAREVVWAKPALQITADVVARLSQRKKRNRSTMNGPYDRRVRARESERTSPSVPQRGGRQSTAYGEGCHTMGYQARAAVAGWATLLSVLWSTTGGPSAQDATGSMELRGGRWFTGTAFVEEVVYVDRGRLTRQRPPTTDSVVDLTGLYVIPPLGDAHTHHFDNPQTTPQLVARYLDEGTFYAKVVTEPRSRAIASAAFVNSETSIDVIYAHGGLTSSYSHPIEVYESVALGFMSIDQQRARGAEVRASRLREGDAYYIIDSLNDLDAKWPTILAGSPDFIKIYLRDAECYQQTGWPKNPGTWGYSGGGLAPELVPSIVRRAHQAGLRVTAAVNTAFDVHVALASGADSISHLPGYQGVGSACGDVPHQISQWDAKLAADRQVEFGVIASEFLVKHNNAQVDETTRANLETLRQWSVPLAIGSSSYGSSPLEASWPVGSTGGGACASPPYLDHGHSEGHLPETGSWMSD